MLFQLSTNPLAVLLVLTAMGLKVHSTDIVSIKKASVDEYLNECMAGMNHKEVPDPEPNLHGECQQWKNRACCDSTTTEAFHNNPTWYQFSLDHCERELSTECRKWMLQDLCFYECSPNVGPWLVEHKITIRDERYIGIPLCRSECALWYQACKDDLTCRNDWSTGWNWTTGYNVCPQGSDCRTFAETFNGQDNFCENIWGGSFKVVDDSESCMFLWFGADYNPNDKVAHDRAVEVLQESGVQSSQQLSQPWMYLGLSLLMIISSLLIS